MTLSHREPIADAYRSAPRLTRFTTRHREAICPFDPIVDCIPAGSSVLDIGCGAGLLLVRLALEQRIARGCGLDIRPRPIAIAREASRRLHDAHPQASPLRFEQAGSPEAAGDEPFDVVTLIDVMHHVPPAGQEAFFRAAAARVAPGGRLVYKDMARRPVWQALANRLHDLVLARQWIHYRPIADVRLWAQRAGLAIRRDVSYSRLAYAHELLLLERT